ncbi:hypothetical protein QTI04_12905 [Variovorax sp. J22R115]|nr:hypothetical protein [Variovorax sp. J22R115]MDM0049913.1 hypothetical protein [Variovorax sp. J22R115]
MAPMTRTRTSEGDVPSALMATYYGQRASAGLIVTEAVDVAPSSKGYAWTPGIYSEAQRRNWRLVTDEIHRKGARFSCSYGTSAGWRIPRSCPTARCPGA